MKGGYSWLYCVIFGLILAALTLGVSGEEESTSLASTTISCGITLIESTVLENDLTNCPDNGLIVGNDYITIDCAGNTIDGDSGNTGIYIEDKSNVTIINCTIQEFEDGIYAIDSKNLSLVGNRIFNNDDRGIFLERMCGTSIRDNIIYGNSQGIGGYSDKYMITFTDISNNIISGGMDGIGFEYASMINIVGNVINTSDYGISFTRSGIYSLRQNDTIEIIDVNGSIIADNNITNTRFGINIEYSRNLNITKNILNDIGKNGIILTDLTWSEISGNRIDDCGLKSLSMVRSDSNIVERNIINTSIYGLRIDSSSQNRFTNNELSSSTYAIVLGDWGSVKDSGGSDTKIVYSENNTIQYNRITNHDISLANIQPVIVYADHNWWGIDDCQSIDDLVIDEHDWPHLGRVLYTPALIDALSNNSKECQMLPSDNLDFTCGMTITEDTVLTNDLTYCLDYGVIIGGDDITLDCAGHSIAEYETFGGATRGILISGKENVNITNCTITGFKYGTYVPGSRKISITSSNYINNEDAIYFDDSKNSILSKNEIRQNHDRGIWLRDIENSIIEKNLIYNNTDAYGIAVSGSLTNSTIKENNVSSNKWGIYIFGVEDVNIIANTITDSENYGLIIRNSEELLIHNNTILGNYKWAKNYEDVSIDARYNWWGTISCEDISGNNDGPFDIEPLINAPYPEGLPVDCEGNILTTTTIPDSSSGRRLYCGDGRCTYEEDCDNCPEDCGECATTTSTVTTSTTIPITTETTTTSTIATTTTTQTTTSTMATTSTTITVTTIPTKIEKETPNQPGIIGQVIAYRPDLRDITIVGGIGGLGILTIAIGAGSATILIYGKRQRSTRKGLRDI